MGWFYSKDSNIPQTYRQKKYNKNNTYIEKRGKKRKKEEDFGNARTYPLYTTPPPQNLSGFISLQKNKWSTVYIFLFFSKNSKYKNIIQKY